MSAKITATHTSTVHTLALAIEARGTHMSYADMTGEAQEILNFLSTALTKEQFAIFLETCRERRVATYRGEA